MPKRRLLRTAATVVAGAGILLFVRFILQTDRKPEKGERGAAAHATTATGASKPSDGLPLVMDGNLGRNGAPISLTAASDPLPVPSRESVPRPWNQDPPSLTVQDPCDPDALRALGFDHKQIPDSLRAEAMTLLDAWNKRMHAVRIEMIQLSGEVHSIKMRQGVDSARVDTPDADYLIALVENGNVRKREYSVGAEVLPDGLPGQVIAILRPGESPEFDQAHQALWDLYDDAMLDLRALLSIHEGSGQDGQAE